MENLLAGLPIADTGRRTVASRGLLLLDQVVAFAAKQPAVVERPPAALRLAT